MQSNEGPGGLNQVVRAPDAERSVLDCLVIGLPGKRLQWTCELVSAVLATRYATVEHHGIGNLDDWQAPDAPAQPCARLLYGDLLTAPWSEAVREGRLTAVVVVDEAACAVAHLRDGGQTTDEAMRNVVVVATALGDLAGCRHALVLERAAWDDPAALVARVVEHIGLTCDIQPPGLPDPASPRARDFEPVLSGAVNPAVAFALTGKRQPIVWPRDCLFFGDRPGEPLPRVLDLTGPSRVLAYGPYFPLPPGLWRMCATVAIAPSACDLPFTLELHGMTELARFEFTASQPGLYKASVPVRIVSPREALECRIAVARGTISGTLGIDCVEFTPVDRTDDRRSDAGPLMSA